MLNKFNPKDILRILKKTPGTIVLLVLVLLVGIFTKSLWHSAEKFGLVSQYGYGIPSFQEGRWWTILIGMPISPEPWMFVIILLVMVVGCGYLEYRYGTVRMLGVMLITQIASVLITAIILLFFAKFNVIWAVQLSKVRDVGMSNAGFGAIGAATAGFTYIWRQRFRVAILLYCLTAVLYSGFIWDITHILAFLVGIAIGPWVVGKAYGRSEFPLLNLPPRTVVAGIASLSVYSAIVTKLYPGNGGIINFDHPVEYTSSFIATIASIMLMTIFIYGLYKGKLFAWWAVFILSSISLVSSLFLENSGVKIFNILFGIALISSLLVYKKQFTIRSDKQIKRKILLTALVAFFIIFIVHVLLTFSFKNTLSPTPTLLQISVESAMQSFGQSSDVFRSNNQLVNSFIGAIDIVWMMFLLVLLAAFVVSTTRARNMRNGFTVFDSLMRQNGSTSITWMARWAGMSYWTNQSDTSAFGFRLINNIAIILSDPVGSVQATVSSIDQFHAYCRQQGWDVAYFSVSENFKDILQKKHYKNIQVGEDTIIELDSLTFAGKDWQSVRSALNKAEKAGVYMKTIKLNDAPLAIKDQLYAIADSWVADKSLPEMGFTLGTLKEAQDTEVVMNIAVDSDGTVHGMTSWMPIYKKGNIVGWTIDIMQRRLSDQTIGGVIEFLIAKSAMYFKDQGATYISLSAAPLANSKHNKTSIEKLLTVLADKLEPYYGFKSLHRFKQKFHPTHKPMYLCYSDEAQLPAISAAIGKAYMNDTSYLKAFRSIIKK